MENFCTVILMTYFR